MLVIQRVTITPQERAPEDPLTADTPADAIFGGGEGRPQYETQPTRFNRIIDYPNIG